MSKEDLLKVSGVVIEVLPNAMFRVQLDQPKDKVVLGFLSGKMRKHNINVLMRDRVEMEMTPYDLSKARITFRYKG